VNDGGNVGPISVFLVDDVPELRELIRFGMEEGAEFQVVGEAGDATSALQSAARLRPDLILLDNHMPGVSGIAAIAGLKELLPQVRVLMLTVSENEADLAAGLRAGADGYLLKTIDTQDLADSIQKVWEGDSVISPEMMGKLVGLLREAPEAPALAPEAPVASEPVRLATARRFDTDPSDRIHSLSPRERDILRLIAHGDSNKLIPRALDLPETTGKTHVQHILRKLELSNRVHAAVYATERGVV